MNDEPEKTLPEKILPEKSGDASALLATRINELIRVGRFLALGPDRVLEFAAHDTWVKLHLPLALTDVIQQRIFMRREFFEAEQLADVREFVPPGSVVVDAGANMGNHTVFFALVRRARKVHSFEPTNVSFRVLKRNVELNELTNVQLHNVGLGAGEGRADLARWVQHNTGGTVLAETATGDYPLVSLDSLSLDELNFLKIDVEGMQLAVLAGARETIRRCRPVIWMELRQRRQEFDAGAAAMAEMGYRLIRKVGDSGDDFLFGPS